MPNLFNRFEGEIFKILISRFFLRSKNEANDDFYKHCSFVLFQKFGTKLKNSSYDGVLGQLINSNIDISFKPGDFYLDQNLIDFSHPIYNEPYYTLQFINNENILKDKDLFDALSIFVPSIGFFIEYTCLFAIGSLIAAYLFKLSLNVNFKFFNLIKLIFFNDPLKAIKRVNFFSIFMINFIIFKWILHQLLLNNINTSKIIIDTSEFVSSKEKLWHTNKESCFVENTKTNDFFSLSPNDTLAHYVFYKLTDPNDVCFMLNGIRFNKINQKKNLNSFVVFLFGSFTDVCLSLVQNFYQSDVLVNKNVFFDMLLTSYIRKSLDKKVKNYLRNWYIFLIIFLFFIN